MLLPSTVTKQPWEIIQYSVDVSRLIGDGTISDMEVKVFTSTGTDVTTTMLYAATYSGAILKITLQNGTDGQWYNVRIRLTMDDGQRFEEDFTLFVKEAFIAG